MLAYGVQHFKSSPFFLKILFIYSVLAALSLCCCEGFPLAVGKVKVAHYSLAVVLLIAMAFSYCTTWAIGAQALVVAAHGLSSCGSLALEHRLNSCATSA